MNSKYPIDAPLSDILGNKPIPAQEAMDKLLSYLEKAGMIEGEEEDGYLTLRVTFNPHLTDITAFEDAEIQINHPGVIGIRIVERADFTSGPGR